MAALEKKFKAKWGVGQYLPEPQVDETDRSVVLHAKEYQFDSDGYKNNKPLQKDIYHIDPYITCSWCNEITFVDVVTIQRMLALPQRISSELGLAAESLPPCLGCKRVDCFHVGPHDFSALIANRKKREAEYERLKNKNALIIQTNYRRHLRRMYGEALKYVLQADYYYKYNAALKICALARGRLGRRIAGTERCLKIIKQSHPLLIKYALRTQVGQQKTFWYKRQIELDLLYSNYIDLVQKTGFQPARIKVEQNIKEISIRVLARKNVLIVLVQRRWRGFMARRIVKFFSSEVTRLFQVQVSRVLKIQRLYRGHRARLWIPKLKHELRREKMMDSYLNKGHDHLTDKVKALQLAKVKNAYVKERREEFTSRATSKIELPSEYDGQKMLAFWKSCYADEKLGERIAELMATEQQIVDQKNEVVQRDHDRKAYLYQVIAASGPPGFGLRGVSRTIIDSILEDKREEQLQSLMAAELARREALRDNKSSSDHAEEEPALLLPPSASSGAIVKRGAGAGGDDVSVMSDTSALSSLQLALLRQDMEKQLVPFNPFYISNEEIAEKAAHLETFGLVLADSSRMKGMRLYFDTELQQITANFIARINNNEVTRASGAELLSRFKDYNDTRLGLKAPPVNDKRHHPHQQPTRSGSVNTSGIAAGVGGKVSSDLRKSVSAAKLSAGDGLSVAGSVKRSSQSEAASVATAAAAAAAAVSGATAGAVGSKQTTPTKDIVSKPPRKSNLLNKGFKYPADINFKAMEWLYDDDAV